MILRNHYKLLAASRKALAALDKELRIMDRLLKGKK